MIKHKLIKSYMQRHKVDWHHPQVHMLDLQYHDIRPDKGLYHLLERRGEVDADRRPRGDRARGAHAAERHSRLLPRRVHSALS